QFLVQKKSPDYDLVALKYSTNGDFVWSRQWGDAGSSQYGTIPSLGVDNQGDVFVSNSFKGTLDLDPTTGTHLATNSSDTVFERYVVRLDAAGNFVWAYTTDVGGASIRDIDIAPDGSIILGGYFSGTTDFQSGPGTFFLTSVGPHANGLVVKLNNDSSLA